MATVADEVFAIFARKGESAYYGEEVSQLEHALQAAHRAQEEKAGPAMVVAALVHDIGHLLEDIPEDTADLGIDAKHEEIGREWLRTRFSQKVSEPVSLHVSAKRYLCATEAAYFACLSPASVQSLELQGGPMSVAEVTVFEQNAFYRDAITLRRWDDLAKVRDLETPTLESYRNVLNDVAAATYGSVNSGSNAKGHRDTCAPL